MPQRDDTPSASKDQPLRRDVSALGAVLGQVLQELGSDGLYERVEAVRLLSRRRREGAEGGAVELALALGGLSWSEAQDLVRAFSAYFFLTNMCERVHRVRRRDSYRRAGSAQPGGWRDVLTRLSASDASADDVEASIQALRIEPVFTAHPTEAVRRSLLRKEYRIAQAMIAGLPWRDGNEGAADGRWLEAIREELSVAWQTGEHLPRKPTVSDEVEHVLFTVREVIYKVIPSLHDDLDEAFEAVYDRPLELDASVVRVASWVGGDMDGNPGVGADTMAATLARHQQLAIELYMSEIETLAERLSHTRGRVSVTPSLERRLQLYRELLPSVASEMPPRLLEMPYRCLLQFCLARLRAKLGSEAGGYADRREFRGDLDLIIDSLEQGGGRRGGARRARHLRRRLDTFGFHFATLDVRQDALLHRVAMGQLLADPGFVEASREERSRTLDDLLESGVRRRTSSEHEELGRCLAVLRELERGRRVYGVDAVGPYIISMAQGPDDALALLALARTAGLVTNESEVPLDIAPLFETVPDLKRSRETLEALFSHPIYRQHLRTRGDRQVVMLGYSDSNKESGLVASRWALFEAQQEMVALCDELGVSLELFHGRGGTVSRGGSKPREGILCAPDGAVRGHLRVTEQGEIIRAKFGLEPIASRTLELMGAAILERGAALPTATPVSPARARAMSIFADASRAAFRGLIYDDPGFFSYFRDATPIDVIERLRIGSRPSARRKQRGIEDLRAIPWVFSWTQSRHILPGWFGVGAGLAALERELGIDELRTLSRAWPFFTNLLNDVEMVLAKADMDIARRYAELCVEQGPRIFSRILEEYQRTVSLIERVREQALLASEPVLARAIALRNPYVDPMSLIQIDLLARWRASDREDADLERALVTTVQGIARGLQNTG